MYDVNGNYLLNNNQDYNQNYNQNYNQDYNQNYYQNYNNNTNSYGMNENKGSCCFKSYFRVLNALKNAPALDVYANEMLISSNLKFGEFSRFMKFMPGNYHIVLRASGSQNGPLFETIITIEPNLAYTGAITGDAYEPEEISLYMIPDEKENADMNRMSAVKVINLSMDSPLIDLVSGDGTVLFSDIKYGDVTNNVAVPAGTYTLHIRTNGQNILTAPNVDFAPKMYNTLFIIGEFGENPKIELIIPEDGLNYLDLC